MTRARRAVVLAVLAFGLAGCSVAARQKAADDVRLAINRYCDARQKVIEALGVEGSEAVGLGEAGAAGD